MRWIALSAAALGLAACSAGLRHEERFVGVIDPVKTVEVVRYESPVPVPQYVDREFREELFEELYEKNGFRRGKHGMRVAYRYLDHEGEDDSPEYYRVGTSSDPEESIFVEVVFLAPDDTRLGRIIASGKRTRFAFYLMGPRGGAYRQAAKKIAHYARDVYGQDDADLTQDIVR